jgi:hypothetical protein
MTRATGLVVVSMIVAGHSPARAQDWTPGPGTVVVTVIPAGATFFAEAGSGDEPAFGNYDLGGSVEVNLSRYVGVEGEISGALGVAQNLRVNGHPVDTRSPTMLSYSGNLVLSAVTGRSLVPYVTAGVGGLTLFDRSALGIVDAETFLTSNVGGGVKWFRGRWGLRGDYRFIPVRYEDDAPGFFGRDTRYGHRVYGGIVVTAVR